MLTSKNLSLEEKIGQLFLIGIDGTVPDERVMRLIQRYRVGGIVLYRKNIASVKQLLSLINTLKSQNIANQVPLFIAIAEEGGSTNKMPQEINIMPSVKDIASMGDKNLVYEAGSITGDMLKRLGFNLNLAPVLDVETYENSNVTKDRCFSANANIVASYGIANMNAMNEKGIVTAIKHFPGQGSIKISSDSIIIPYSKKSLAKLEEKDLLPFKEAIKEGTECIMVGHINLTKFNLFAPATTSKKVIKGLLRTRYEYNGVLVTDDLCKTSMEIQYGLKDSAARAIKAGNDILIIKDERRVESTIEYITRLAMKERIDINEIDNSVDRILKLKEKYLKNEISIENFDIDKINKKIDTLVENIKR